ncbi:MAG: sigma 54-interacting transcriptional regulator [Myxococcales bacterium]|nr:sigma 54-interacting transcriptional regulator [Myxococcales bacterium]
MDALLLSRRGAPLREFRLADAPLRIGRSSECDIQIPDPEGPSVAYELRSEGAEILVQDLRDPTYRARRLERNEPLRLGRDHCIERIPHRPCEADASQYCTQPMLSREPAAPRLSLLMGRGRDARLFRLRPGPFFVGAAGENDLQIADPTVSGRHCRLDISREGVLVRDLASRNGTWVGSARIDSARLRPGAILRVGRTELVLISQPPAGKPDAGGLIAESAAMLQVLADVRRFAQLPWPALVRGESGVGKEHIARALHPDSSRPFIALNAGALPSQLIESELFGHERGAFTGAHTTHRGLFEQADGGTLFLDEIGELPLELQSRLLRVLETWEVRRVGSERSFPVNVRLVCATHRDLGEMVGKGEFRQDLFYRLGRLVLDVPPLRQRPADIRALTRHFLSAIETELGRRIVSKEALERIEAYHWPGNARELRNVLSAAAARTEGAVIEAADIDRALGALVRGHEGLSSSLARDVLESYDGNVSAAARALGIARSTLRARLRCG